MPEQCLHAHGSVIQLNEVDILPAYVAVYSSQPVDNPFALSPVAMQWSDHIIINRVDDCKTFWVNQEKKQRGGFDALFGTVLSHHYGDDFIAVFANHPWQCLLYLAYQINQAADGIYFLDTRLNQHVYQSLGWPVWFANQDLLAGHLKTINAKGFNIDRFHARQAQLKRFIHRLGLAGPFDLKQADYQSFSRRFETWLAKVWEWTMQTDGDLRGFPWVSASQPQPAVVARDLEYPVNQWQVVEALLREDLERLCDKFIQDENEHINRMLWQIVLFNQHKITVELSFRHPYSLHRDNPEFITALYQARYIYEDLIRKLQARDSDLDLPETMPLVAWRIEVCECFSLPPIIWDLFGSDDHDIPQTELFNLQNKLPVNFESYRCEKSFYPEQSFKPQLPGELSDSGVESHQPQWRMQSIHRPLFYYPAVQRMESPGDVEPQFLERCGNDWWQSDDCNAVNRDYYCVRDSRGRASWAYRDYQGYWFKQGEYS